MKNETKDFFTAYCELIAKGYKKYLAKKEPRKFKKGDIVFSTVHGKGKVERITSYNHPIWVVFDDKDRARSYTQDGKYCSNMKYPSLFHYDTYKEDIKRVYDIK
ncbi:MAG: hypothetical protein H3C31_11185 [Brumimicrobium sp.]|nr:hypothetical protein [Brumimicrobium sp.]